MGKSSSRGQRVRDFAGELKLPIAALLVQLQKAGVMKLDADDLLSEGDKSRLLEYLRAAHRGAQRKVNVVVVREKSHIRIKRAPAKQSVGCWSAADYKNLGELVRQWKTFSAVRRAEIRASLSDEAKEVIDRMTLPRRSQKPRTKFHAPPVRGTEALAIPSKADGPVAPDLYKAVRVTSNSTELEAYIRAIQDAAYRDD